MVMKHLVMVESSAGAHKIIPGTMKMDDAHTLIEGSIASFVAPQPNSHMPQLPDGVS